MALPPSTPDRTRAHRATLLAALFLTAERALETLPPRLLALGTGSDLLVGRILAWAEQEGVDPEDAVELVAFALGERWPAAVPVDDPIAELGRLCAASPASQRRLLVRVCGRFVARQADRRAALRRWSEGLRAGGLSSSETRVLGQMLRRDIDTSTTCFGLRGR